jgi:hypothetical protein
VRLTVEEAAHVKSAATAHGLSAADFIRAAILRDDRRRSRVARRFLAADAASTIRELSRIATNVGQLLTIAEANGEIAQDELSKCVSEVHAALAGFGK